MPPMTKPAENLDAAGDGDHHAGRGKIGFPNLRQAGGEHMVDPQTEGDETIADQ